MANIIHITEPDPGQPIRAEWGRTVARYLNSLKFIEGNGIRIRQTAAGTVVECMAGSAQYSGHELSKGGAAPARVKSVEDGYLVCDIFENGLSNNPTYSNVAVAVTESSSRTFIPAGTIVLVHMTDAVIIGEGASDPVRQGGD